MGLFNLFSKDEEKKLTKGLSKTKDFFLGKIAKIITGKSTMNEDLLDKLEEILITSDIGVDTTLKIINRIQNRIIQCKFVNSNKLIDILKEEIISMLQDNNINELENFSIPHGVKPYVIMVVGVNGVGKTTTIAKLAYFFKKEGKKVFLGAADTFRAAAVEQLNIWNKRIDAFIVKRKMGVAPASVAYDTLTLASSNNADVAIIDTAGRLHNKINLMNELIKIKKAMKKIVSDAPHEILLILDGSTGQNAYNQAKEFFKATEITALAITKLDGTAKGGVVIGISDQLQVPVKYIGFGEELEDLQVFRKKNFVNSLFKDVSAV